MPSATRLPPAQRPGHGPRREARPLAGQPQREARRRPQPEPGPAKVGGHHARGQGVHQRVVGKAQARAPVDDRGEERGEKR